MAFHYFRVPVTGGDLQAELNAFLTGKKVLRVEQHFVPDGPN